MLFRSSLNDTRLHSPGSMPESTSRDALNELCVTPYPAPVRAMTQLHLKGIEQLQRRFKAQLSRQAVADNSGLRHDAAHEIVSQQMHRRCAPGRAKRWRVVPGSLASRGVEPLWRFSAAGRPGPAQQNQRAGPSTPGDWDVPWRIREDRRTRKQAADLLLCFSRGKTLAEFTADPLLRSAIEHQLEIIGETLSQLSKIDPDTASAISEHRCIP